MCRPCAVGGQVRLSEAPKADVLFSLILGAGPALAGWTVGQLDQQPVTDRSLHDPTILPSCGPVPTVPPPNPPPAMLSALQWARLGATQEKCRLTLSSCAVFATRGTGPTVLVDDDGTVLDGVNGSAADWPFLTHSAGRLLSVRLSSRKKSWPTTGAGIPMTRPPPQLLNGVLPLLRGAPS